METCVTRWRLLSAVGLSLIAVVLWGTPVVACSCNDPGNTYTWVRTNDGSYTNIHCSGIIQQYLIPWFHYKTETCGLKVKEV